MSDEERMMPNEEEARALVEELRRRITDTLPTYDAAASSIQTLTSAQASVLLDETRYELDPGPSPGTVAAIREELEAGDYSPTPTVVLACIDTQRRCVKGHAFLEALAGLDATWPCMLQTYRCERWSQVSSLFWSYVIESIAP